MDTTSTSLGNIVPRSGRAALQLGIAVLGAVVILGSLVSVAITFAAMSPSDSGFAEGLAIMVFGLYVLAGFVILAIGLRIPQREGEGIQFSRRQRTLLAYGAVAPVVSVLLIPIGAAIAPPLAEPLVSVVVAALAGLILSGPIATLAALGLKIKK